MLHKKYRPRNLSDSSERQIDLRFRFGVLSISIFPGFGCFQEGGIIMAADKLQRLSVLGVFIAGMMHKGLNDFAGVIVCAIGAGNVTFGQTTSFHFAFCAA